MTSGSGHKGLLIAALHALVRGARSQNAQDDLLVEEDALLADGYMRQAACQGLAAQVTGAEAQSCSKG